MQAKPSITMTAPTMKSMTSAPPSTMMTNIPSPMASPILNAQAMASQIVDSPTAGMWDMSTMKNMCSLPGMHDMCNDNTHVLIALCAALLVMATSAVILRLLSRRISALSFWWDDAAIVLSLLVSYGCSALAFVDAKAGVGRHFETVKENHVVLLFKTTVAYEILYSVCITLIKISILLFYYRLFAVRKAFQRLIFIALALVICWCLAKVLLSILQCIPVRAAWIRPYPHSKCVNNNVSLLSTAITNVVIDLAVLILPIEPIWQLNLTTRRKCALTAIFCLGAFICAAAMIRVWAIQNVNQTDVTWSYLRPLTWSGVEISIGITCACLPILQPFFSATVGPCFGRISGSSHSAGGNAHRREVEEISGATTRVQPQMARVAGEFSRKKRGNEKRRMQRTVWGTWVTTDEEEEAADSWSTDVIPLKGIHDTKEIVIGTTESIDTG